MKDKIENVRIALNTVKAAFNFANDLYILNGKEPPVESKMQILITEALTEIEKEEPNIGLIDDLLAKIELEAKSNSDPTQCG